MIEGTPSIAREPEAERRLIRPSEGRVLTGVSAGLARYFGLHPLVYRVAFAAFTLLDFAGVILYTAAWLIIPDERRGDSLVGEALRRRRERPWITFGVGVVVLALVLGVLDSQLDWQLDLAWLATLVLGISVVYAEVEYRSEAAGAASDREATTTPSGASRGVNLLALLPPTLGVILAGVGILGVLDATDVVVVDWALVLAVAVVLVGLAVAAGAFFGTRGALSVLGARGSRSPIFVPTLGLLVAGAGIVGVLDATDAVAVDWTLALAGGVVLVGLAVAVGAFFGRTGALAVFGAFLAVVMVAAVSVDVPLRGPIGERTERPLSAASLEEEYEHSIGSLTVDLGSIELPPGRTDVKAAVGIGELIVRVPEGVRVEANADVTAGEADLFGARENGWQVDHDVVVDGARPGAPTLVLDVDVGFGDLEVHR
jgi:phage shock protein PspC (stress-responsive transcriptional regulator)